MKALKFMLGLATAVVFTFSLMPFMPAFSFAFIDLPSHFVFQYAVGILLILPVAATLKMPRCAATMACVLLLNAFQLYPFFVPLAEVPAGRPLKILQTNTLFLNRDTEGLKKLIADEKPDMVVASEANHEFAAFFKTLLADYPHQALHAQGDNPRGLTVISKLPLSKQDKVYYDHAKIPSQVFTVELDGQKIRFISIHPATPLEGGLASRDNVFKNIVKKMEKEKPDNLVILGDFNATPWCPALKKLSVDLGLKNSRAGKGLMPSWPEFFPAALFRIPIDHVLVSEKLVAVSHRLGPDINSDHLPSIVEIAVKK